MKDVQPLNYNKQYIWSYHLHENARLINYYTL